MTCREKLKMEHPECVGSCYTGGCDGCPKDYGYLDDPAYCSEKGNRGFLEHRCEMCWDREIPGIEPSTPKMKERTINQMLKGDDYDERDEKKVGGFKRMTCREKLKIEHPEYVNERYPAGCRACPSYYGYNNGINSHDCDIIRNNLGCEYCWDQEIIEPKDERDEQITKLTRMLESKNGLIGTLKETTQKAKDEVAAKEDYCHEMEIDLLDKIRKLSEARRENRVLISINEILYKRLKDLGEDI